MYNGKFGKCMNSKHLSIDKDGFDTWNQCIFNYVKCAYVYEDLRDVNKIITFLGDTHIVQKMISKDLQVF